MKPLLQIVLFMACLVGVASIAAPTKIEDRHEYSTSLNTIAYIVMDWYGSLITNNSSTSNKNAIEVEFNTTNSRDRWLEYRSQYPLNITQILITHTQLLKLNDEYQFNVSSKINYKNNKNEIQTQSLKETFLFSSNLTSPTQAQSYISSLKNISLLERDETTPLNTEGYDREHYKVREFVYAWLGYLDGLSNLSPGMYGDEWLNKANYSLLIGADKILGSVEEVLSKRNQTLAKGGHLLRTLDVIKPTADDNTFVINLILEWKGLNYTGNHVIAKIHQELKIKIKEDKIWSVISIKEKHLLPTIAPWVGLLC